MKKVFSLPSIRFDHDPQDFELVCLLGDSDCPGWIEVVESPESLVARPGILRMKYIVPWMLFVAAIITATPWVAQYFGSNIFSEPVVWLMIGGTWLLAVPILLALLILINRSFAKKGDYFRVDKSKPALELCQVGKTVNADEILAFTELRRWCRHNHVPWKATRQTGVLVQAQNGQYELYPLFRELEENIPVFGRQVPLADRLARVFQVQVRRITLDKQESQALGDC